jgi:ABC-type transport system involved in cytochrome c biogenesis permease component
MSFSALLWKDARREWRSKEALQAGFVLVALFFVLDLFVFPTLVGQIRTATAILWTPLLYATAALVARGFASEADRGTIRLLQAAPVPLAWHGWSRTLLHALLILGLAAGTLGLGAALFAIPVTLALLVPIALASIGLAIVGTLASALAAQARSRETLLPILLIPVAAPLLQAGVAATMSALAGASLAEQQVPLSLLAGYDLVALGVAWLLWPFVLEGE